jgi:DtxR family Mn-dependent transcriptional regulator
MAVLASAAVEDYLRALYLLEEAEPTVAVTTARLARRLGVTPASAVGMVKRLASLGLVDHTDYRGARLTARGRQLALELTRHHRLLEQFLSQVLDVPWDLVHAEADELEHGLSEDLEARIAARLGEPARDPHGDPIPNPALEVSEPPAVSLPELAVGQGGTFVRAFDAEPAMLRYLDESDIRLGDRLEVVGRQPFGGAIVVRCPGGERAIGGELAAHMRVEPERGEPDG